MNSGQEPKPLHSGERIVFGSGIQAPRTGKPTLPQGTTTLCPVFDPGQFYLRALCQALGLHSVPTCAIRHKPLNEFRERGIQKICRFQLLLDVR